MRPVLRTKTLANETIEQTHAQATQQNTQTYTNAWLGFPFSQWLLLLLVVVVVVAVVGVVVVVAVVVVVVVVF